MRFAIISNSFILLNTNSSSTAVSSDTRLDNSSHALKLTETRTGCHAQPAPVKGVSQHSFSVMMLRCVYLFFLQRYTLKSFYSTYRNTKPIPHTWWDYISKHLMMGYLICLAVNTVSVSAPFDWWQFRHVSALMALYPLCTMNLVYVIFATVSSELDGSCAKL